MANFKKIDVGTHDDPSYHLISEEYLQNRSYHQEVLKEALAKPVLGEDGKLHLLDDTTLDVTTKKAIVEKESARGKKEETTPDNTMKLDTTGVYFRLKGGPARQPIQHKIDGRQLFLDNAFFLLANKKRIMSDSRMFLCRLPFPAGGLAYTGTGGFEWPTLGVYLEWWARIPSTQIIGEDGKPRLLWHLAGSPLTGSNVCTSVDETGKTHKQRMVNFLECWSTFININTHYDEAKHDCAAFSLIEVLTLLRSGEQWGVGVMAERAMEIRAIHNQACEEFELQCEEYERQLKQKQHELDMTRLMLHPQKVISFYKQYLLDKADAERVMAACREQLKSLRERFRDGQLTKHDYRENSIVFKGSSP